MLRAELCGITQNFFYLELGRSLCFPQAAELAGTHRKKYRDLQVLKPQIEVFLSLAYRVFR